MGNGLRDTEGEGEGGTKGESSTDIHTPPCIEQIPTVYHRLLSPVFCDNLEKWDAGAGRSLRKEGTSVYTKPIHTVA